MAVVFAIACCDTKKTIQNIQEHLMLSEAACEATQFSITRVPFSNGDQGAMLVTKMAACE